MASLVRFAKKNTVMLAALAAALTTSVVVPPDAAYAGYFDFKTLVCLFSVLAVVGALKNISFFYILAARIVRVFKNLRSCTVALVYITFIGSMLIANDMALLTFLPLGYFILSSTGQEKHMAFVFIMQNIAANLGGMLTPFGNPQNLFLYTKFNIDTAEFLSIMAPPFLISVVLITVCCLFVKKVPLEISGEDVRLSPGRTVLYLALFALAIVIVFRVIPYYVGGALIVAVLLFADRRALAGVDYPLLLTFVFFFIFAGNMARIDVVRDLLGTLLARNTLLVSVLSCQVISNVPSAILLSSFTENYAALLVGVNIGGVGTLISSLASLITFREYVSHNRGRARYYIGMYSAFNFAFLFILAAAMTVIM